MKKLIAMLLVLVMVLSLGACTKKTEPVAEPEKPATTDPAPAAEPEKPAAEPEKPADPATPAVDTSIIPASVKLSDSKVLNGKKIGCSIVYKGDEWCYALAVALETLGKYYGADITVEDGDLNDETQTKQIENMVANKCDMLMIDPTTPAGTHEALMKAVDADIPIIIYDGYWEAGEENALTTVSWDQNLTGRMVGEYFVQYVKDNMDGKARVVELTNAVSTHCQERFVGLHSIIDEANKNGCDIQILNKYDSQGNRETAYNAIAAIVEPFDFVISDVDNGAMGAVSALQASGNTDVKVFSMGAYGAEPFTALHTGDPNYQACLNVDPWIVAQFVFEGAIAHYEGKPVETRTNIDLFVVDGTNVTDFWTF